MMNGKINALFIMVIFSLAVGPCLSQDQPSSQTDVRRNIRDNIFTLRALRMTQILDLTQEQTAVIFPELSKVEKEKAELQQELAREIRDLRSMIREDKGKPEDYELSFKKIKEIRNKIRAKEEGFEEFLESQLTPVQKAKYVIFNLDFNRRLMERVNRARILGQKNK
jgi:hypothetical protein